VAKLTLSWQEPQTAWLGLSFQLSAPWPLVTQMAEEFPELRKPDWAAPVGGVLLRDGGAVNEQMIKQDIENQNWDEDDQGFKITAPTEP
jgi:hypothetical protein